ncbi:MAG: ferrous iron transporter B, partial [Methylophilaceae bacterium]|nr:ferrous iron transporter B [Methylophilaceae bacterium]
MKRVALLGMPNTGKSTFFNRISGASARVGNWPGITVDLMSAKILLGGHIAELIDLPGIYDLHGFSDDEQVVRHFLTNNTLDLIIILANSAQIDRQLSLALQLKSLGLPTMLLLNMRDEAKRAGIRINTEEMAAKLNMPVVQISAKYGDECPEALKAAAGLLSKNTSASQPEDLTLKLKEDISIEQEMESIVEATV